MAIVLESGALDEIVTHAARTYPHECCGALLGDVDGPRRLVRAAWPLANVAAQPARRYAVAPADYKRIERRADESGVALVGFYHSHPDAASAPSAADLACAWPHFLYVIVSVGSAREEKLTCWRVRDDRSAFESEEITCRRES